MNSFGNKYRLTTFGESHGSAIGGVVDGVPAGFRLDIAEIQAQLDRRRPGASALTTARNEADKVELLSGLFEGVTIGTPIGFIIRNKDHHSADYEILKDTFRPGHADYTYQAKYGIRDYRGGGRASARETACRVVAGAIARQILAQKGISIEAMATAIGPISLEGSDPLSLSRRTVFPGSEAVDRFEKEAAEAILKARAERDSLGGIITCIIKGYPAGEGEPIYDKLQARLASAMLSINAVKAFDYGGGFDLATLRGSEVVDEFVTADDGSIITTTNYSGGIQGGISNGMPIFFRVGFKPVATLPGRPLHTVDTSGEPTTITLQGRHDPCVIPRAVPVVEAMAAISILDFLL